MYRQLTQRNSLCILICVFLVSTIFAGRATHSPYIYISNSFLGPPSIKLSAFILFVFTQNYTTFLWFLALSILLIFIVILIGKVIISSKKNKLLTIENLRLQQEKESAELVAEGNAHCLSTICHEVRTPLSSSSGILKLLQDTDLNPEQLKYLKTLEFSSDYLISLSDNVLMLNKLNVTKPEIRHKKFDLKETFRHLANLLRNTADANNTTIILELDPRIPNEIIGDKTKISQILINLLSNSVRFTPHGKIWIRTLAKNISADSVEILIEIQDSGIGIPKEEHQLIFEPFSQGSQTETTKKGGTGLGLAIVKVLLEILGSKIEVASEPGIGSTFWFTLKCGLSGTPKSIKRRLNREQLTTLANKSVLIVEDDLISQMITKKLLERESMNCKISDNGEEAINLIKNENFNLVLMDLSIHGKNGQAAVKEVRKFNKDIPIIALTAVNIDEKWQELKNAGFDDVIPKPFKIDYLFKKIYRILKNRDSPLLTTSSE